VRKDEQTKLGGQEKYCYEEHQLNDKKMSSRNIRGLEVLTLQEQAEKKTPEGDGALLGPTDDKDKLQNHSMGSRLKREKRMGCKLWVK